jgi:hypothetical protein
MYRSAMSDCSAFITHNVLLTPHYLPHTLSFPSNRRRPFRVRSLLVGGRGVGGYSCVRSQNCNVTRFLFLFCFFLFTRICLAILC